MNMAITDGLVLMPPPFAAGLNLWSRENGTPGSASYQGAPNAALVPADQDFGPCLELQKNDSLQKLRYMGQTPFAPGLYLRVTVRIKAVSGNLPSVRIAAWAGNSSGGAVSVPSTGPLVPLNSYGQVMTLQAIIGSGNRQGVDMVWGTQPAYAHVGLDLTGANGGVVRIDDIQIDDITEAFHRKLIDVVDVRDFGALGNGTTDDSAAFAAADAGAGGRTVLVSAGTYRLASNVTFQNAVRFEGTVTMASTRRLVCTRNFDLDTYAAAFGDELEGFRRGVQALFNFTDHVVFDLSGRKIEVDAPINVAAITGQTSFSTRRVISNGQLAAIASTAWDDTEVSSVATYATSNPLRLTGVANVANIPVGARVTGAGVGREVYVRGKNVGAGTLTLSAPLWNAAGTRTFTFTRFKYLLDFSGFDTLSRFELTDLELTCAGRCSAVMLPDAGLTFRLADCVINAPKDRGITSIGEGCAGLIVDQCQFLSNEQALPAQNRRSIALNANGNDVKLRDNRVVRFAHFAVLGGENVMMIGNHFFQGDDQNNGVRQAGVVLMRTNPKAMLTGNYIDNCFIEWTNEQDAAPDQSNEFSFGGLTLTGNIFLCSDVTSGFRFIVVRPRGPDHFINGLTVSGNIFRATSGNIDRVEKVDSTNAGLDLARMRNLVFDGNTFHGVTQATMCPVTVSHTQNTEAATWTVDGSAFLPFGGMVLTVTSVVADGELRTAANALRHDAPQVVLRQGTGEDRVQLRWPVAVRGRARVTLRCDTPV